MGKLLKNGKGRNKGLRRPLSFYVRGFVYLGLILTVQFAFVGLVYLETGEKVLYTGLSSDDVVKVSKFLKERGIMYRMSDSGSTILVRGNIEKIQEEFEDNEWRETRLEKESKLSEGDLAKIETNLDPHRTDAIRKELEKLLTEGSEKIAWARVGFQNDEKIGLEEGDGKKGAAVFIGTDGQALPSEDVERIQWVVANSFAGLKPTDVTVLDEVGRELTHQGQN